MGSTKKTARLIGLLYVLLSVVGIYGLLYVPSHLAVHGDPAATAQDILASEGFFRSGVVANLLSESFFIVIAALLYRLLKGVDKTMALLMVLLLIVQIPIVFAAEMHHLSVLTILQAGGPDAVAQMSVALDSYDNGMLLDEIFMGLWLFPFGWLVWKCGFLPRFLGVLLIIAGCAYFAEAIAWLWVPAYGPLVGKFANPLRALELITPLWLLIIGAKDQPLAD